jgi:hypothetical protein
VSPTLSLMVPPWFERVVVAESRLALTVAPGASATESART